MEEIMWHCRNFPLLTIGKTLKLSSGVEKGACLVFFNSWWCSLADLLSLLRRLEWIIYIPRVTSWDSSGLTHTVPMFSSDAYKMDNDHNCISGCVSWAFSFVLSLLPASSHWLCVIYCHTHFTLQLCKADSCLYPHFSDGKTKTLDDQIRYSKLSNYLTLEWKLNDSKDAFSKYWDLWLLGRDQEAKLMGLPEG